MHLSAEIWRTSVLQKTSISCKLLSLPPHNSLLKIQISTTINYMLLQCPSLHTAHSTTLSVSVLYYRSGYLLGKKQQTGFSLRVKICALARHYQVKLTAVTDQTEFWIGATAGKLSCTLHMPRVFSTVFSWQETFKHTNFCSLKSYSKFYSGIQVAAFCKNFYTSTTKTLLKNHSPFILTQKSRRSGRAQVSC